ncbi:MAG: hypothetical protein MMC33_008332 [Icmadophila ericetorum]|nr:hypothetical protein [Icmadophila ericetorum]
MGGYSRKLPQALGKSPSLTHKNLMKLNEQNGNMTAVEEIKYRIQEEERDRSQRLEALRDRPAYDRGSNRREQAPIGPRMPMNGGGHTGYDGHREIHLEGRRERRSSRAQPSGKSYKPW